MRPRMRRGRGGARFPGALPLALLCVAFAGLAAAATLLPPPTDESQAAIAAAAPAASTVAADAGAPEVRPPPGLDRYADIAARPVFRPTRRPPEPVRAEQPPPPPLPPVVAPPPPPPPPPAPLPPMTLVGVVIDPAGRTALLQAPNQPATLSVRAGDSVEGWLLAEIRPDGLLFRRGAQEQELAFPAQQAQSTAAAGRPFPIGGPGGPGSPGQPAFAAPAPMAPVAPPPPMPPPSAAAARLKKH